MKTRINKFLADQGICSRRQADELVSSGRVTINGRTAKLGDSVESPTDEVKFDGKTVSTAQEELEYWAVYKPIGVVSSASDEKGRKNVTDLVKSSARLYPIGRLDINTDGLMVLTNDGELTNIITHPSYEHKKYYRLIARKLNNSDDTTIKQKFEKGIRIDDKIMKANRVLSISKSDKNSFLEIELELITGYNRQIRRMCDKIGLEVRKLTRVGLGKLQLKELGLEPGQSKKISKSDLI